MSITYNPTDGSDLSKFLGKIAEFDREQGDLRVFDEIPVEHHQALSEWTSRFGISSDSQIISWRARQPFTLPKSWAEVGMFVGVAVAIQLAYWVIWPSRDVEDIPADGEPGGFPIDKINPMRRQDVTILQQTESINNLYLEQQQREQQRVLGLQELYRTKGFGESDIEQLLGEVAAMADGEGYNDND